MRGGYRPGAGRKQGFAAKQAEEARRVLAERVAAEIGPISDTLISKAKEGDIRAIHELFDRAWGRAPQALEVAIENYPHSRMSDAELQRKSAWLVALQKSGLDEEDPKVLVSQLGDLKRSIVAREGDLRP